MCDKFQALLECSILLDFYNFIFIRKNIYRTFQGICIMFDYQEFLKIRFKKCFTFISCGTRKTGFHLALVYFRLISQEILPFAVISMVRLLKFFFITFHYMSPETPNYPYLKNLNTYIHVFIQFYPHDKVAYMHEFSSNTLNTLKWLISRGGGDCKWSKSAQACRNGEGLKFEFRLYIAPRKTSSYGKIQKKVIIFHYSSCQ